MEKIILTTTASFYKTVEETDLKDTLAARGLRVILHPKVLIPPFSFDTAKIVGLVAGHTPTGDLVKVGYDEAGLFPNLKVVTPFGVGIDHLNREGIEKRGVAMKTLPHFSKRTVAELAIAFLFNLARRVAFQNAAMKSGVWERINGNEINGKTLGIIGLGSIGKEVAKIARALGMKVAASDIVYDEAFLKDYGVEKSDLNGILSRSDFLTLHVPLTDKTENLINKESITKMKRGVFIINTSRGAVVDEGALLEGLQSGQVAGAALDVFSVEPPFENEAILTLIKHPNVITTPHVGAFTPETRYAIAKKISEEMLAVLA